MKPTPHAAADMRNPLCIRATAVGLHASGWDGPNRTQHGFKKEVWGARLMRSPTSPKLGYWRASDAQWLCPNV